MSVRIAITLVLFITAVTAIATADAGSCGPKSRQHCANHEQNIDLTSVPDITRKIVDEEPFIRSHNKPANEPAAASPYTGPIFGAIPGKRTPTVGYSWSLE